MSGRHWASRQYVPATLFSIFKNGTRLSDPFDGHRKHISDSAFRLEYARRAWIALQLPPDAQDLHIDTAIEDILVYACRL
jgi:hypothetical protein